MRHANNASLREYGPLLLIGLTLLAGLVFSFVAGLMWHDRQRIEQIALLMVVAFAVATRWREHVLASFLCLPNTSRFALGLGFALGAVSAMLSAYPRIAGLEWATLFLLLGLAFLVANQARLWKDFDRWAMRLVLALSGVIALKIMMGYVAAMVEGVHLNSLMLFDSTFSNRRVFGQVASMVIPLLAYPLLMRKLPLAQRWGVFFLLATWWMLVIVSGTRGTWMALAGVAVLSVFAWRAGAGWLKVQALAFAGGALLFGVLFVWLPSWIGLDALLESRLSNMSNLKGRSELWTLAWSQIQGHPWLGIGPMHLASIPIRFGAHPHNAVLQLAAEWGVPAALALILPAVLGVMRLMASVRKQSSPNLLLVCLTASLLAAGAQSMVDGVIVIPYTQIWLAWVAGWALGAYFRGEGSMLCAPDSRPMRLGGSVLFLFAFAALLNGVFPEILNRVEATQAYVESGHDYIPPRYWAVGQFP